VQRARGVLLTAVLSAIAVSALRAQPAVASFEGVIAGFDKKQLLLKLEGEQSLSFHITRKTRFLRNGRETANSSVAIGEAATVEGKKELNGELSAVTVSLGGRAPGC
jgi:hypothetical protein